ncbi:MAG: copper resistance protein CopC, partial [Anaerolineae bacterium]
MTHRFWKLPAILLLVALATTLLVPAAMAHATLVRSDPADGAVLPASPREVRLWFDEDISANFSTAQLLDAGGRPVAGVGIHTDPADPTLLLLTPPPLPDGVYSVLYKVLSNTDGHFSQGLLVFGVGEGVKMGAAVAPVAEPPPPLTEVVLRWLNFGLLASIVGALAVRQWVLRPSPE